MKQAIKRWLTNGNALRDYYPVANIEHNSHVNVIAHLPTGACSNVTNQQWTLAYNPIMVGIFLPREWEGELRKSSIRLEYRWSSNRGNGAEKLSEVHLRYKETLEISVHGGILILFEATHARNFQLSFVRRSVLLYRLYVLSKKREKYFNTLSLNLYRQYVAQFTFPRKVMMIAVEHENRSYFFPVDLQGRVPPFFFFGLRHSNKIIQVLQETRKVVICFIPASEYKTLYYLGKFSKEKEVTPITYIRSLLFKFQVPEFALGYYEIELTSNHDIGSQQLFIGKVANSVEATPGSIFLYHVHMLQVLAAQERDEPYTLLI
jgi:flavin reductase (DIM6/NTAB) family NADH-FMN oxidoreductase RutF